jgi:hypothetical protein
MRKFWALRRELLPRTWKFQRYIIGPCAKDVSALSTLRVLKLQSRSSASPIYQPPPHRLVSHRRTPSSHWLFLLLRCPHYPGASLLGCPCQCRRGEAGGPCRRNYGRQINATCARRPALIEVLTGLWNKNPSDSIPAPEIERIRRTSDCQVPAPSRLHRHGLGFLHSVLTSLSCRRHSCVAAVMRYLCLPPAVASSIQTTRLVRMLGFSNLRYRGLSVLDC